MTLSFSYLSFLLGILAGVLLCSRIKVRILETRGDLETVIDAFMTELQRLPHEARQRAMSRIFDMTEGRVAFFKMPWTAKSREKNLN